MTLRRQFQPLLLSTTGLHADNDICRQEWDNEKWTDEQIRAQMLRAESWLFKVTRTTHPNSVVGSSYSLKHRAEDYHANLGVQNCYISNGAFLMAAHTLGFKMRKEPYSSNAVLNISAKGLDKITPIQAHNTEYVASPLFKGLN